MRPPRDGDQGMSAPGPVRRQKRNLLRRHWLSGALICGVVGLMAYTGTQLLQAEAKLREVRSTRAELETRLQEERRKNQTLVAQLQKVTSDPYMELLAKQMGFIHPNEIVYQQGTDKGR